MTIDFRESEIISKITPQKNIIDFEFLGESLSDDVKFKKEVQNLCKEGKLPLIFPSLPLFLKAQSEGLVVNKEYIDGELSLPKILYDCDTYKSCLELRGPMEEILIAYERERTKQGLSCNSLLGDGWSKTFVKRFNKVREKPIGKYEEMLENVLDRQRVNQRIKDDISKRHKIY